MGRAKDYFTPQGIIAKTLHGFEHRREQVEMAEAVEAALENRRILLIEAGTGVGKSFAYLVPAALWALEHEERVIVSTNTITLQEQLIGKDIPFLRDKAGLGFTAALAKGRGNYLCIRRLLAAVSRRSGYQGLFEEDDMPLLSRLEDWFYRRGDGTLSTLDFSVPARIWMNVRVEREACSGRRCSYFKACPYFRDRAKWESANLLVVNHSLFFSDLALRLGDIPLLPGYGAVVFDEAHTLEDIAARHMGVTLGWRSALSAVRRIYDRHHKRGFFAAPDFAFVQFAATAMQAALNEFFHSLAQFREKGGSRVRTPGAFPASPVRAGKELADALEEAIGHMPPDSEERQEALALCSRVKEMSLAVSLFTEMSAEDFVYWVEGEEDSTEFIAVPAEVGERLRKYLWRLEMPFVLTSATLATSSSSSGDACRFIKERLGLEEAEERVLGSPFDFKKQVRLYIPSDVPDPGRAPARYLDAVVRYIREVVEEYGGGVFVLFTSIRDMNLCHERLRETFEGMGLQVFVQGGDMPRNVMLERFRADGNAVLFGVSSFWQGVDVKGEALRAVIMARLPFDVPGHPLIEARREALARRGLSDFQHYSLPSAVLRLKQGFGRLVRTRDDTGTVVLLDPRILNRSYGRHFLQALPPCPVITAPSFFRSGE